MLFRARNTGNKSKPINSVAIAGGCLVLLGVIGVIQNFTAFEDAVHKTFICQTNLKAMGRALAEYTQDNNETLPPANHWFTASSVYIDGGVTNVKANDALKCPAAISPFGYAFNANLGSRALKDIADLKTTVMLFEADAPKIDMFGGKESLVATPRHNGKQNILFAYGFARNRDQKQMSELKWKFK